MDETTKLREAVMAGLQARSPLVEGVVLGRASCFIVQRRPREWVQDPRTGLLVPNTQPIARKFGPGQPLDPFEIVDEPETVWNLITNAGRVQMHKQCYGTSGLGTNGFNYIALSNDTLTETASSTTLSTEIAANGLSRAQGTVTLASGSGNQTTVDKTFTATGSQSAQKGALFDASSAGNMQHALAFTQRALISGDTLQTTWTLTLG